MESRSDRSWALGVQGREADLKVLLLALHVPFPEAKYLAKDGRMTSEKCSTCESYKRAKLTKQKAIAAAARRPTSSQLCVRGLSCDSDAYGCVGIVAVVILAALAGAVEAEAPTSLVAILALDVEARPCESVRNRSSSRNSQSNSSRDNVF